MDKARYLVEAHLLEGRSVSELAAAHGVHRSWIYKLLARYRAGGFGVLERRSRAPRSSPNRTPDSLIEAIVTLREQLSAQGHDCGAQTIARRGDQVPSASTIWRILRREGLVVPQPQKRPRSSLIHFCAELPNEMWQADVTHWRLAGSGHAEILNMIDDPACSWPHGPSRPSRPPTWSTPFAWLSPCMVLPPACSAITVPCSPPPRGVARSCCR